MSWTLDEAKYAERLNSALLYKEAGKITKSMGLLYEAHLPGASVGSLCQISSGAEAEVIGFRDKRVLLMPFDQAQGVNNDSQVLLVQRSSAVRVGHPLLGRVIDARGRPIDDLGPVDWTSGHSQEMSLYRAPSHVLRRQTVREPLDLGIRSLKGLLTCGKGQRLGIMAGSGVGKSVLLGMMARYTSADINVIALIGERGREVKEFIERDLGPEGLRRSVVVVATSDASPLLRMRGAFLAASIAEYFRDQRKSVLLLMDSVTRFAMAQREIGLSLGEPPASKGYTPSVFATLPKLLERAGTGEREGSITGLYTVLVEGDDMDEPIADAARSILDGHVVLSRRLAQRNQYPAVDVLQSASRVMSSVTTVEHREWAARIREWMAVYAQAEDLINIGAYVRGTSPKIDQSIAVHDRIESFLRQGVQERATLAETLAQMHAICRAAEGQAQAAQATRAPAAPARPGNR
ncbi:MAG: FliI/YscN family ATPase [Bdellovibrionales bacterium]|nr:FliI/YscN family ATPase [Bdellovibrionales bacterium]